MTDAPRVGTRTADTYYLDLCMVLREEPVDFFWLIADQILMDAPVNKGSMMGFPCLRLNGHFFAMADQLTGDLIVKLSAPRVNELIKSSQACAFAPASKPFREWVRVHERDPAIWKHLINEAREFARLKESHQPGRRKI